MTKHKSEAPQHELHEGHEFQALGDERPARHESRTCTDCGQSATAGGDPPLCKLCELEHLLAEATCQRCGLFIFKGKYAKDKGVMGCRCPPIQARG